MDKKLETDIAAAGVERRESIADSAVHDDKAVWESRETYVPAGFAGVFASPYVTACAMLSAVGGLLFGYDQGVISIILVMPQFLARFTRIDDGMPDSGFWKGFVTAMLQLGAFFGAFLQGWLADKYSRKYAISISVVIFTVGSILQVAAVDYAMLIVARTIGGIGIGGLSMVAPLYISEISPPEIRGVLLVMEEFSIVTGIIIAYWITYGTQYIPSEWSWRLPLLIQIFPGIALGFGVLFLPFSPRWLAAQGRDADCFTSLSKLRRLPRDDRRIRFEWFEIKTDVTLQKEVLRDRHPKLFLNDDISTQIKREIFAYGDLFRKKCWRRTIVGVGVAFFQQFIGINALIYYSPTLFETLGQPRNLQLILAGVLNIAQLVGVIGSLWGMDMFGRKALLLSGSVCTTISQVIIAALTGLYSSNWGAHQAQGWVAVGFLFFYMVTFGGTWGPVAWALPAEIFPSSLRAKGVGISTGSIWINNFIIGLVTPPMLDNIGYGTYVFFAVFSALSFVFVWIFVKETKGKTLEQMDHVFKDATGAEDEQRRREIEKEIAKSLEDDRDISPETSS